MATITFNIHDFKELLGKEISTKEILDNLPYAGFVVENHNNNEITVEVTPNRPDCLSVEGLARAFKGFLGIEVGLPKYKVNKGKYKVIVHNETKKVRPYIACAVAKNVTLNEYLVKSIMQVQEKIHDTIGRRRKKIAIGFYDLDKINFPVHYTTTKPEENSFVPLDFEEKLTPKEILKKHPKGIAYRDILKNFKFYPMLKDGDGNVMSLIPIINSERSKVESDSKNLFIDVTGTDEKIVSKVLDILVTMLSDRGAKIYSVNVGGKKFPKLDYEKIKVNVNYINKLLGLNLNEKDVGVLLKKMRLEYKRGYAIYPSYRVDIMHPIDITEDVAISYDYRNFEPVVPNIFTVGEEDKLEIFSRHLRNLIVGFGAQEVMNYILTNKEWQFDNMNYKGKCIEVKESKSEIYNQCRSWLLPGLMLVLSNNTNYDYPQRIFELDDVILPNGKSERRLSYVSAHTKANFSEIKSIVESILKLLSIKYEITDKNHPSFINGRCAYVKINGKELGFMGEIHPKVLKNWNLEVPVCGFEINISLLHKILNK